jgi:hypothetical protein
MSEHTHPQNRFTVTAIYYYYDYCMWLWWLTWVHIPSVLNIFISKCRTTFVTADLQITFHTFLCVPCPCTILYKNTNHQQMHKESFITNRNTLLHVSTLLGHLQGELFCYCYTKGALYSWVRMCCWLCTVYWRHELSAVPACTAVQTGTTGSSRL